MYQEPERDTTQHIEDDIRQIVGGNFSPDALGPDVYEATLARVRARPAAFLEVFERLYLGMSFDALAQSHLYLPSFLEIVREQVPEQVREGAAWLLERYNAVLILYDEAESQPGLLSLVPEETARLVQRLEDRRSELSFLAE